MNYILAATLYFGTLGSLFYLRARANRIAKDAAEDVDELARARAALKATTPNFHDWFSDADALRIYRNRAFGRAVLDFEPVNHHREVR